MTASYDVQSIEQYLHEAKTGRRVIYASSVALAEVVPSAIKRPAIGTFKDFIAAFQGSIVVIDTTPNVMLLAAELKDMLYRKKGSNDRRLSTGDAITLASCVHLVEAYGVAIDAFHTFDDGKKRDPVDGKMVPLLSYHEWVGHLTPEQLAVAQRVTRLNRRRPIHPSPTLFPVRPPAATATVPTAVAQPIPVSSAEPPQTSSAEPPAIPSAEPLLTPSVEPPPIPDAEPPSLPPAEPHSAPGVQPAASSDTLTSPTSTKH